ncbi:hypothetical protein BBK36DRAFT_1115292 [Trichoderma citrinoviride]|uniref:Uncharacterized protein n=1 Tax=Trichoderma citrinoviride TaxID=58853 RepID=A0A2T4BEU8_9HYPO|nr:hypothetical protein BBK36DRAFT_1115292 [Trichoderma citrinoviride]PTB67867.1 hypothetical protein BBK36DRAFT_1115292 [Trichoderma citrinoviride]
MSQRPSTPVKVPPSAANYTPATLDPDLRSQINSILLKDGHVAKIQEALLHALNSNSSNWPTAVQNHALNLLRSGEVTTFPALLRRVLDDVRESQPSTSSTSSANGKSSTATNGGGSSSSSADNTKKTNGAASDKPPLAIPTSVIEEALRITRESLDAVCEIEEKGSG